MLQSFNVTKDSHQPKKAYQSIFFGGSFHACKISLILKKLGFRTLWEGTAKLGEELRNWKSEPVYTKCYDKIETKRFGETANCLLLDGKASTPWFSEYLGPATAAPLPFVPAEEEEEEEEEAPLVPPAFPFEELCENCLEEDYRNLNQDECEVCSAPAVPPPLVVPASLPSGSEFVPAPPAAPAAEEEEEEAEEELPRHGERKLFKELWTSLELKDYHKDCLNRVLSDIITSQDLWKKERDKIWINDVYHGVGEDWNNEWPKEWKIKNLSPSEVSKKNVVTGYPFALSYSKSHKSWFLISRNSAKKSAMKVGCQQVIAELLREKPGIFTKIYEQIKKSPNLRKSINTIRKKMLIMRDRKLFRERTKLEEEEEVEEEEDEEEPFFLDFDIF